MKNLETPGKTRRVDRYEFTTYFLRFKNGFGRFKTVFDDFSDQ